MKVLRSVTIKRAAQEQTLQSSQDRRHQANPHQTEMCARCTRGATSPLDYPLTRPRFNPQQLQPMAFRELEAH